MDCYENGTEQKVFSQDQHEAVPNLVKNSPVPDLIPNFEVVQEASKKPAGSSDEFSQGVLCSICGDKATGKHYGANSCDGCKGFFRRSVRKDHSYTCGFSRICPIDKDKRNQCRFCRLKKCFRAGMRKAAVQNERDKISNRRPSFEDTNNGSPVTLSNLVQVENQIKNNSPANTLINSGIGVNDLSPNRNEHRLATPEDVCDSMKTQLLLLVEWAKNLQCFVDLPLEDQIALLRSHAGEMLILGVVWRSLDGCHPDTLLLGNNLLISRQSPEPETADMAASILEHIFHPIRSLDLDETEFIGLKAIVFFDPNGRHLSETSRQVIRRCRRQIQFDLMNHMNDKQYADQGRFGEVLLLLPDLRTTTQLMVHKVQLAKIMGVAKIDSLLSETLLTPLDSRTSQIHANSYQHLGEAIVSPPTSNGFPANYYPGCTVNGSGIMSNISGDNIDSYSSGSLGHLNYPSMGDNMGNFVLQNSLQPDASSSAFTPVNENSRLVFLGAGGTPSVETMLSSNQYPGLPPQAIFQDQHQQNLQYANMDDCSLPTHQQQHLRHLQPHQLGAQQFQFSYNPLNQHNSQSLPTSPRLNEPLYTSLTPAPSPPYNSYNPSNFADK